MGRGDCSGRRLAKACGRLGRVNLGPTGFESESGFLNPELADSILVAGFLRECVARLVHVFSLLHLK